MRRVTVSLGGCRRSITLTDATVRREDFTLTFGSRGLVRLLYSPGYRQSASWERVRDHAYSGPCFPGADLQRRHCQMSSSVPIRPSKRRQSAPASALSTACRWWLIFATCGPIFLSKSYRGRCGLWRRYFCGRGAVARAPRCVARARCLPSLMNSSPGVCGLPGAHAGRGMRHFCSPTLTHPRSSDDEPLAAAQVYWDRQGVLRGQGLQHRPGRLHAQRRFEMQTVLAAARELQRDASRVKFILAGDGDDLESYRKLARGCDNVIFPGG